MRYHRLTRGLKVGLLVEIGEMNSRDLYTVLPSDEAVALVLPLLPHIIHHSLTVDPPDSLINLKQRTEAETETHQSETKALVEKCPPPSFVTVELFFCGAAGGGGNLL